MMKKGIVWLVVLMGVVYFFPWKNIGWGKITLATDRTVTVTGYAESKVTNQIANFSAGVSAINDKKDVAVNEVNQKMTDLVKAIKELGIEEADIKTFQVNVYQMQQNVEPGSMGMGRVKLGQWSANNSVEIVLRNVDKASELTDVLTKSGATNVYGPNFSLDTSNKAADKLIGAAIEDSKIKAEAAALAGGAKLGKLISVSESGSSDQRVYPMMAKSAMMDSTVPAPMEAGSTTVSKTITAVWGLE